MHLPIVDIFVWGAVIFITVVLSFWGFSLYNRFSKSSVPRRRYYR